jgi:ketosteroid isomerase-like protein
MSLMDNEYTDRLLQKVRAAATSEASDNQANANHGNANHAVLHAAYSAVVQGNFEVFAESVADDVELNIRGFEPMEGTWRGRNEVVEGTRKNFALVSGQQPEIEAMIAQGDSVAVLLRESGVLKSNGQAYSLRGVQWFTFVEGKIKRIDEIVASVWKAEA